MRIGAVRFKNGCEVRLLRPEQTVEDDFRHCRDRLEQTLRGHKTRLAGFAMVVWGADNGSSAFISTNELSRIPSILVPDFVRNRLLASQIETWILQTLEKQ